MFSLGPVFSYVVSALSIPLTSGWKLSCFLQVGVRDMGNTGDVFNTAVGVLMEEKEQPLYLVPLEMLRCPLMSGVPVQFVWMWLLSEQNCLS